jgi:hypothetical protein
MRQDRGVSGDAQRLEQLGWLLFLKILDEKDQELELIRKDYQSVIPAKFQWRNWATDPEGITGEELLVFIDHPLEGLFSVLRNLKSNSSPERAELVREVFDGSNNYINPRTGAPGTNTGNSGLGSFLWDNPGSYFLIAEAGPDWTVGGHKGKFRAGWFEQLGDTNLSGVNGNSVGNGPVGTYAYANQQLFNEDPDGLQGLEVFGQFSWSDPNQNSTQWSMMLGSQWEGLIDVRPNDTVGLLWAYNKFTSNDALTTAPGSSETILETFYNVQVTPWFLIQPDMQYISQPSPISTQSIPGAFVFTMRLTFIF